LTSTTAGYVEATFVLNGAYNPVTASGNSLVGFQKYMAFYSKAWVLGARIKASCVVPTSTGGGWCAGLVVSTNINPFSGIVAAIDNGMCDYQIGLYNPDRCVFNQSVDIAKFMNKPKLLDDNQFFCTSGANPSQIVAAHLFLQGLAGSTSAVLASTVEIEMDVVFTDPIVFV